MKSLPYYKYCMSRRRTFLKYSRHLPKPHRCGQSTLSDCDDMRAPRKLSHCNCRKMIETTAIILKAGNEPFEIANVLIDSNLQAQDVLVEILATGICHTDIGVQKLGKFPGKFPRVLGHEGTLYPRRVI